MDDLTVYIEFAAKGMEITGILTVTIGIALALIKYIFTKQGSVPRSYRILREQIGKAILLGLEILVAGDIISTVAAKPQMENVLVLGAIVLIRTFLSLSIEVEIEGKLPWKRASVEE